MSPLAKLLLLPLALLSAPGLGAQQASEAPLARALGDLGTDVQRYHEHIVTLASPFLDGRLPGTDGMELAKDYCQYWLSEAGVSPGFRDDSGASSWRQPFPLGASIEMGASSASGSGSELTIGSDFQALSLGSGGIASGTSVWVGYGIEQGPDGYTSFPPNLDLTGKIAFVFRFEPMNEVGTSLWGDGRWTGAAGFGGKIAAVAERNPAAIVIVNPPGADDPRVNELMAAGEGGNQAAQVPVLHMTHQAASQLHGGMDLLRLRQHFDHGGDPVDSEASVKLKVEMTRIPLIAENVGGMLRGKGALADELIIMGAHLDHLGMGEFGSRSGPGELHPGADDNASGSAAILMLADQLKAQYDALPDGAEARSILFILFSGEESGLNGSRFYVNNPPYALANTSLMINFDMIGRIQNRRLQIGGTASSAGLLELVQAQTGNSELEVVIPEGRGGGSDHLPFMQNKVPYLFGAIADFHDDYHTPRDVASKINRVDATRTVHLFRDIAFAAATAAEGFRYQEPGAQAAGGPRSVGLGDMKVRFGAMPGNYEDSEPGIAIGGVTKGGSAETAGIREGDRLLRWEGQKIIGVMEWMEFMVKHKPGDKVKVGVVRDGKEITIEVTLQARDTEGK
jgi:peptidase M28-like protein/PDZ domain-containing protein